MSTSRAKLGQVMAALFRLVAVIRRRVPGGVNGPGVYIDGSTSGGKDAATTTVPTDTTGIFINLGTTPNTASVISTVSGNTDTLTINSAAWGDTPYTVTINYSGFQHNRRL